jgi:hypothetical protein
MSDGGRRGWVKGVVARFVGGARFALQLRGTGGSRVESHGELLHRSAKASHDVVLERTGQLLDWIAFAGDREPSSISSR